MEKVKGDVEILEVEGRDLEVVEVEGSDEEVEEEDHEVVVVVLDDHLGDLCSIHRISPVVLLQFPAVLVPFRPCVL